MQGLYSTDKIPYVYELEDLLLLDGSTLQLVCRFHTIPIHITPAFLVDVKKLVLKFMLKCKGPMIAKPLLKRTKLEDSYFMISKFIVSHSSKDNVVLAQKYK